MAAKFHPKTEKRRAARRNKPSRAARLARRAKERDEILAEPARATERVRVAFDAYQNELRRAAELRRHLESYKQLKDYQF